MDRGVTLTSERPPQGLTCRPSGTQLPFPGDPRMPIGMGVRGMVVADASTTDRRITKVEGDLQGLRSDVASLKHSVNRLDASSENTALSLSFLLEAAGFTPEKIAARLAERASAGMPQGFPNTWAPSSSPLYLLLPLNPGNRCRHGCWR